MNKEDNANMEFNIYEISDEDSIKQKEPKKQKINKKIKNNNSNLYKDKSNFNIENSLNLFKEKINNKIVCSSFNDYIDNNKQINYDSLSCRYDSFFFIYANVIYPHTLNNENKNNNLINFNKIAEILLKANFKEKNLGFWKIIEKYKLDNIGILEPKNNPFNFDNIGSVYKFFNNNSIFCLKDRLKRFCSLCTYNINIEEYFNSYITINLEELNKYKNIEDKIHDLLIVSYCSCPVCGINYINKLEKDEKYKYCFKSSFEIISYPKYIFFLFDMEVSDNSLINYENLKQNQNKILSLLRYQFNFDNKRYRLLGIINMPQFNHYNSCIINCNYNNNYVQINKNFYCDCKVNNSEIYSENFEQNNIKNYLKKYFIVSGIYVYEI